MTLTIMKAESCHHDETFRIYPFVQEIKNGKHFFFTVEMCYTFQVQDGWKWF